MPFITSIERLSHARGLRKGIESLLRMRFGREAHKLLPEIHEIYEEDRLEAILKALETAASPDEVRPMCSPSRL